MIQVELSKYRSEVNDDQIRDLKNAQRAFEEKYFTDLGRIKEQILRSVLKDVLKREPTEDDAKECQLVIPRNSDGREIFCYKHIPLGVIYPTYNIPQSVLSLERAMITGYAFDPQQAAMMLPINNKP